MTSDDQTGETMDAGTAPSADGPTDADSSGAEPATDAAGARGDHGTQGDPGYQGQKAAYQRRLRLIEGQVRGLHRMVDEDAYCIDVLTQVSAVTKALQSVALGLVDDHIHHCVHDAARTGDSAELDRKMDEIMGAVKRLMR